MNLSKEEKRELKQFKLITKKDFEIYLAELIVRTQANLKIHKRYLDRLNNYIGSIERDRAQGISKKVDNEIYEEYVDLLSRRFCYILNLMGDRQETSLSYYKFRQMIKRYKNRKTLEFEIRDIDEEIDKLLKEFNLQRNWQNHVPESLLTSTIKMMGHDIREDQTVINPLIIKEFNYCTLELIKDLYNGQVVFYDQTMKVLRSMKKDYSCLIGETMKIFTEYADGEKDLARFEVNTISAQVQGITPNND